jgi:uncharacterized peroxidase-related enzyme
VVRIEPLNAEDLPAQARPILEYAQQLMGFVANDVLTMARWPELLLAMQQVVAVVYGPGQLDDGLKRLVGMVASAAAGCRYCQAHTAHGSSLVPGMSPEKTAAAWDFETSELFDHRERAALRIARGAGQTPNAVTDAEFEDLQRYFDEREIMEIIGVVCLFGFLNRWNDTLATELESVPLNFASTNLPAESWTPGKHAAESPANGKK